MSSPFFEAAAPSSFAPLANPTAAARQSRKTPRAEAGPQRHHDTTSTPSTKRGKRTFLTNPRCHLPLSRFFRERGPCHPPPAPHTGMQMLRGGQGRYGNVDLERLVMGKNRERVRSCFSPRLKPPRQTRGRPQFIAIERITPRAATAFKIYYAVKSHLAAARRCGASRRHAGGPRLSRPYPRRAPFRSEVARRHAGGPRLSRPYPRRARSEVKSRGVMREGRACRGRTHVGPRSEAKSRGVMREGRACRGRTRAASRSEVKSRGIMREGRACRGRTRAASRSEAKSRGVMREGRACRGRTHAGPVPK